MVCTRWMRVMNTSALIWERARFELPQMFRRAPARPRRTPDPVYMTAWFRARRGRFKQLGLKGLFGSVQLPPAVTSMLMSTQAASHAPVHRCQRMRSQ